MISFSLILFSSKLNIWRWSWSRRRNRGPTRQGRALGGRPPPSWIGCGPTDVDSFANIFYEIQKVAPQIFRSFRELLFLHKNNTMAVLLKQRQSGLVPLKSCKLESKTRAKVFGKVDTTEMYQLTITKDFQDSVFACESSLPYTNYS